MKLDEFQRREDDGVYVHFAKVMASFRPGLFVRLRTALARRFAFPPTPPGRRPGGVGGNAKEGFPGPLVLAVNLSLHRDKPGGGDR
jgi:hypothetical protein